MSTASVILDTNVFVAAGFNRRSSAARMVEAVREGKLRMVWNESTRRETQYILDKIPPLSFARVADLFRDEDRFDGETKPEEFAAIADPDDRKFAALADATGAVLVTNDEHLLSERDTTRLRILTPRRYWELRQTDAEGSNDP
jgi:predicted nucleic acid-binding protein